MGKAKGGFIGSWNPKESWTPEVQEGPRCDRTCETTRMWGLDGFRIPSPSAGFASPHVQAHFLSADQIGGNKLWPQESLPEAVSSPESKTS